MGSFRVNKKEMVLALGVASRFANPRSPALPRQCVRVVPVDGAIRVQSSGIHGGCDLKVLCEGEAEEAIVNCDLLSKTASLISGDDISISSLKNKIRLKGAGPSIDIPAYDQWISVPKMSTKPMVTAGTKELLRCVRISESVGFDFGVKYADGVRFTACGNKLEFAAVIPTYGAYSWMECTSSEEFDVVISKQAIQSLHKFCALSDEVDICVDDARACFSTQGGSIAVSLETTGSKPPALAKVSAKWVENSWNVHRDQMVDFLRHTAAISTNEATGVWIEPKETGLYCRYVGMADGARHVELGAEARCEFHVEGDHCPGKPVFASSRLLSNAIAAAGEDDFRLGTLDGRAVLVHGRDCLIAVGQMAPPSAGVHS